MKVYKVKEVDTHGGSLRVYATKDKNRRQHKSVNHYIELEKKNKLDKIETYYKFAKDVKKVKVDSLNNIKKILSENKKILGYGAPAKATTILNYFGLNENYFKYVIDDSEIKHGKYIPETNIQIISKDDVDTEDYDLSLFLLGIFMILLSRTTNQISKIVNLSNLNKFLAIFKNNINHKNKEFISL